MAHGSHAQLGILQESVMQLHGATPPLQHREPERHVQELQVQLEEIVRQTSLYVTAPEHKVTAQRKHRLERHNSVPKHLHANQIHAQRKPVLHLVAQPQQPNPLASMCIVLLLILTANQIPVMALLHVQRAIHLKALPLHTKHVTLTQMELIHIAATKIQQQLHLAEPLIQLVQQQIRIANRIVVLTRPQPANLQV